MERRDRIRHLSVLFGRQALDCLLWGVVVGVVGRSLQRSLFPSQRAQAVLSLRVTGGGYQKLPCCKWLALAAATPACPACRVWPAACSRGTWPRCNTHLPASLRCAPPRPAPPLPVCRLCACVPVRVRRRGVLHGARRDRGGRAPAAAAHHAAAAGARSMDGWMDGHASSGPMAAGRRAVQPHTYMHALRCAALRAAGRPLLWVPMPSSMASMGSVHTSIYGIRSRRSCGNAVGCAAG